VGTIVLIGLGVLAFLGIRAALQEERKRRTRTPQMAARQDAGVPLFSGKRRD